MKYREKFTAFETNVGKYSSRKIPQTRIGSHELQEYLEFAEHDVQELLQSI